MSLKVKTNNNSKKKKKEKLVKECYGGISPQLLPEAALATAIPKSARELSSSRSPSPLACAIASFTKVGHSIIGDTSQRPVENATPTDAKQNENIQGKSILKRLKTDCQPIPTLLDDGRKPENKSEETVMYAEIGAAKKRKSKKSSKINGGKQKIVSDMSSIATDKYDKSHDSLVKKVKPKTLYRSVQATPKFLTLKLPVQEKKLRTPNNNSHTFSRSLSIVSGESTQENIDHHISEGQVQFIQDIACNSREQIEYLSHEPLSHRQFFEQRISAYDEIMSPSEEFFNRGATSFNSSLSSSEIISPDQLVESAAEYLLNSQNCQIVSSQLEQELFKEKGISTNQLFHSQENITESADQVGIPSANIQASFFVDQNFMDDLQSNKVDARKMKNCDRRWPTKEHQTEESFKIPSITNVPSSPVPTLNESHLVAEKMHTFQNKATKENCIKKDVASQPDQCMGSFNNKTSVSEGKETESKVLAENYLHMSPHRGPVSQKSVQQVIRSCKSDQLSQQRNPINDALLLPTASYQTKISLTSTSLTPVHTLTSKSSVCKQNDALSKAMAETIETKLRKEVNEHLLGLINLISKLNTLGKKTVNEENDGKLKSLIDMMRENNYEMSNNANTTEDSQLQQWQQKELLDSQVKQLTEDARKQKYMNNVSINQSISYKEQLPVEKAEDEVLALQKTEVINNKTQDDHQVASSKKLASNIDWYRLKEQAKLVIQENKFLLEQKYIQKDTVEELTRNYLEEIQELSHKVLQYSKDNNKSEHQLFQLKRDYSQLQTKHEAVIEELKTSIQYSKHEEKMKALESSCRCEIVKLKNKNEDLKSKLKASANEQERLALKAIELNVANNQLLVELEAAERAIRKYERRLMTRDHQLENKKSKANTSIKTLKQVVSMAEKGLVENETLELQLHSQKYKTALAMFHLSGEEKRNKKLFKQIERYRDVSKEKVEALDIDLKTRERDMESVMETYLEEIYEIKKLLKKKQQLIEEIQSSKSLTMNNIEEMRRTFQEE